MGEVIWLRAQNQCHYHESSVGVFHSTVSRRRSAPTFDRSELKALPMIRLSLRLNVLLSITIVIGTSAFAVQRTVDNSPNSPGQFTSLQDAIYASSATNPRDTLLITGTNISYGTVTVDRPLVLIGAGYNPNSLQTIVDQVNIRSSDVFLTGLHCGVSFELNDAPGDSIANVIITRCQIGSPGTIGFIGSTQAGAGRLVDIKIINNVISSTNGYMFNGCDVGPYMQFDSLLFANNISARFGFNSGCLPQFQGTETFIMDHNLFIGPSGSGIFTDQFGTAAWNNSSAVLSNNIFHLQNAGGIQGCGQCTWFNNLTTATGGGNDSIPGTPLGNMNLWSVDPTTVLVNYPGGQFDWSHDYSLQSGSPALGNGTFGTDIGPFDGPYPFELGVPPAGPFIEYFNVDGSAIEINGDVIINFKAYGRP